MAHESEYLTIAGTKTKVATGLIKGSRGKTQTINVYRDKEEGDYRQVYRISDRRKFVSVAELRQKAKSLEELDDFLINLKGAVREGPRSKR